jgi:uncharacterized cupin superfamily protein
MAKVIVLKQVRAMDLPGRRAREIVGAEAGAVSSTIRLVEIEPGDGIRGPHVHRGVEESIHVLAGQGITRTDTGEYPVTAGDTVLVPAGERHATYNTGTEVLRLLCFFPVNDIRTATEEFPSWNANEGTR